MGSSRKTDTQLNISCTVAPAKDLLNTSRSVYWPIATMVFVTEVPIFAPIIIGIACMTVNATKKQNINQNRVLFKCFCLKPSQGDCIE